MSGFKYSVTCIRMQVEARDGIFFQFFSSEQVLEELALLKIIIFANF